MTTASIFDQMSLGQLEEASGELHRRAGSALRRIGEAHADDPDHEGQRPRERISALIASSELAIATLAALAGNIEPPLHRQDRVPLSIAVLMYGAPTLDGLLSRLEQNRRMLASLARHLEPKLDEVVTTGWGDRNLRQLLIQQTIEEPARCAQSLEQHLAALKAAPPDDATT